MQGRRSTSRSFFSRCWNRRLSSSELIRPFLRVQADGRHMIADANAQRKYEDSKALSVALEEIRAEIANITNNAIA